MLILVFAGCYKRYLNHFIASENTEPKNLQKKTYRLLQNRVIHNLEKAVLVEYVTGSLNITDEHYSCVNNAFDSKLASCY
jgi:5-formaminoimidazole-4-carboxamide-1-beta-D-ribofuranosyl 5'-monophosphate synthetase